jgi:hypothetical protein
VARGAAGSGLLAERHGGAVPADHFAVGRGGAHLSGVRHCTGRRWIFCHGEPPDPAIFPHFGGGLGCFVGNFTVSGTAIVAVEQKSFKKTKKRLSKLAEMV